MGERTWSQPTPTPERGQGPWHSADGHRWWVVADDPDEAIKAVREVDAGVFPVYSGWRATIELCCIRWVYPEDWDEEHEIVECPTVDDPGAVSAWRITVCG